MRRYAAARRRAALRAADLPGDLARLADDVARAGVRLRTIAAREQLADCLAVSDVLRTVSLSIADMAGRAGAPPSGPPVVEVDPGRRPPGGVGSAWFRSLPPALLGLAPELAEGVDLQGVTTLGELAELIDGQADADVARWMRVEEDLVPVLRRALDDFRKSFLAGFRAENEGHEGGEPCRG